LQERIVVLDTIPLKVNPNLTIEINPISEGNDCVVVDNFLADPEKAVAYASQKASEFSSASAYPGVIYPPEALRSTVLFAKNSTNHCRFIEVPSGFPPILLWLHYRQTS
jgi:hypothetical protein